MPNCSAAASHRNQTPARKERNVNTAFIDMDDRTELRQVRTPGARSRRGDTWPTCRWKARKRRRGDGRTTRKAAA